VFIALLTHPLTNSIRTLHSHAQAYKAFLSEADRIASTPEEQLSTTLLVLPDAFTEFVDFAAFTEWLEDELDADEVSNH
jgi:hypothetical protein